MSDLDLPGPEDSSSDQSPQKNCPSGSTIQRPDDASMSRFQRTHLLDQPFEDTLSTSIHNTTQGNDSLDLDLGGDLSDVETEVTIDNKNTTNDANSDNDNGLIHIHNVGDDALSSLSPSLFVPLLESSDKAADKTGFPETTEQEGSQPRSLFDGLVIVSGDDTLGVSGGNSSHIMEREADDNKVEKSVLDGGSEDYQLGTNSVYDTFDRHIVADQHSEEERSVDIIVPPQVLVKEGSDSDLQTHTNEVESTRHRTDSETIQEQWRLRYPNAPLGASILEIAEFVESRLSYTSYDNHDGGDGEASRRDGTGNYEKNDEEEVDDDGNTHNQSRYYQKQLFVARIASQVVEESEIEQQKSSLQDLIDSPLATSSTIMGTHMAARAFISPLFETAFKKPATVPTVLAKYSGVVAVGCSTGRVWLLMPSSSGAGTRAAPQMHVLEASDIFHPPSSPNSSTQDAVTSLAMGQHGSGLLLVAGHSSGQIRLWETKPQAMGSTTKMTWSLSRTLTGVHASSVGACAVLESGAAGHITWLISADAHGRVMCHNVNKVLSLTAQALAGIARQWVGGTGAIAASTAASTLVTLQAAGQDPGIVLSLSTLSNFVLITATRAVLMCEINTADGSMAILHIFFPPKFLPPDLLQSEPSPPTLDAPDSTSGYAAWYSPENKVYNPIVAVAWGDTVSVYQTTLTPTRNHLQDLSASGETSMPSVPRPLPTPHLLTSFCTDHPVSGIDFVSNGFLVLTQSVGQLETRIHIYHPRSLVPDPPINAVESIDIPDWMIVRQIGMPGVDSSLHGSLAPTSGNGDQLLVLTSKGVRVIHLLTWNQKLSSLIAMQRLGDALVCAARLYLGTAQYNLGTTASNTMSQQRSIGHGDFAWPADCAKQIESEEVSRQLLTIARAFIDSTLSSHSTSSSSSSPPSLASLADIAINACLLISRPDVLFGELAPKFLRFPSASAAFLQQLEPHILDGELPSIAPEIMQALVEHYASTSTNTNDHLERIERCVLKLDILSLDLNQLIPLCLRHGLYGALIHIFSGALQDYSTPAVLLLITAAKHAETTMMNDKFNQYNIQDGNDNENDAMSFQKVGYRLLVYLKNCLSGMKYPPGSGAASLADQQSMRLHTCSFLLHSTSSSLLETWRLWASVASAQHEEHQPMSITLPGSLQQDPTPALRFLCSMDAPALLNILSQGLRDWDALESDITGVMPDLVTTGEGSLSQSSRTMTQAFVDAVAGLLDDSSSRVPNPNQTSAAQLQFIAQHLASNRASADYTILIRVLRFLADKEQQRTDNNTSNTILQFSREDRESIFKDIVMQCLSNNNNNNDYKNGVASPGKSDCYAEEALELARYAGFYQAQASIYKSRRQFAKALQCLVQKDAINKYPRSPFRFIRDVVTEPGLTEEERSTFQDAVVAMASHLVKVDTRSMVDTIAECFTHEMLITVLESLSHRPDDQFAFLQAAIADRKTTPAITKTKRTTPLHDQDLAVAPQTDANATDVSVTVTQSSIQSPPNHIDPLFAPLLKNKRISSLYVQLLCRFRPSAVLSFLQSHDTYDVDDCLEHCIEYGVRAAAAFLLERKGDINTALKFYLEQVNACNASLMHAVKTRGTNGLPGWSTVSNNASNKSNSNTMDPVPDEFMAARDALHNAISMCIRFGQDRVTPVARHTLNDEDEQGSNNDDGNDEDPVRDVWVQVLQQYVLPIRTIRQECRALASSSDATTPNAAEPLHALEFVFTAFMEEVIGQMTGHVPLQSIASAVMKRHSDDPFGDLKAALLSLLGACNFELAILRCASRVTGTDTIALLKQGYTKCMKPEDIT